MLLPFSQRESIFDLCGNIQPKQNGKAWASGRTLEIKWKYNTVEIGNHAHRNADNNAMTLVLPLLLFPPVHSTQSLNIVFIFKMQKQPSEVFYKKRCSQKFRKIYRKTPVSESVSESTLFKKDCDTGVFLWILGNF